MQREMLQSGKFKIFKDEGSGQVDASAEIIASEKNGSGKGHLLRVPRAILVRITVLLRKADHENRAIVPDVLLEELEKGLRRDAFFANRFYVTHLFLLPQQ